MFCYCLFCETGKCGVVAREIEMMFPCQAIRPKQIQHTKIQGKPTDIEHDLLPGYVFLYAEDEPLNIAKIRKTDGVIRCLSDSEHHYELQGGDEQFALILKRKNGVIGKTPVYQEGQMIRIRHGVFEGMETKILKVNRRNMRMQIEIPFASTRIKTWVEYEMVDGNARCEQEKTTENLKQY
ncbi:MAG: hypothetical protein IJ189_12640 [Clostridia bacterium]|nr:hypothetical protein [Clostridia bacterium]